MSTCPCKPGEPCVYAPDKLGPCPHTGYPTDAELQVRIEEANAYLGEPTDIWLIKIKLTDESRVKFELLFPRGTMGAEIVEGAMDHMEETMRLSPASVVKFSCERIS